MDNEKYISFEGCPYIFLFHCFIDYLLLKNILTQLRQFVFRPSHKNLSKFGK
jgi:hypothetical protein